MKTTLRSVVLALTLQSLCPDTERARQWLCANGGQLYLDFDL